MGYFEIEIEIENVNLVNKICEQPATTEKRLKLLATLMTLKTFSLPIFTGYDASVVNTWLVALNIVGKFGMTMGFAIIYIWSAEIFPTSLRTSLMGISSMVGRVGQILAPFIADIVSFRRIGVSGH